LGPWLRAVSARQKCASHCLHQQHQTLLITKTPAGAHGTIRAAIHLIQKWVTPWQQGHKGSQSTQAVQQAMVQLAAKAFTDSCG
jgi:hypothetical protein